jgi:hypothetical protein
MGYSRRIRDRARARLVIVALGPHHDHETAAGRAERLTALLNVVVLDVEPGECDDAGREHFGCLIERDAVLASIACSLSRVPFEAHPIH